MLFLSIGLWCVVVYSMRIALLGNPLHHLITRSDPGLVQTAERVAGDNRMAATERELRFLQRFSRLTLLELGAFLLEMGLLLVLWVSRTAPWLCFGLLAKNFIALALSAAMARSRAGNGGVFESLLALPAWVIWADRVSALLSGVGCFVLFLAINGLLTP